MSTIAGFVSLSGGNEAVDACASIIEALKPYGAETADIRQLGAAAFGRNLHKLLPEDEFDTQPLLAGGSRWLLTSDLRIDNRDEIEAALGLDRAAAAVTSDAALLAKAWEEWGSAAFDRLIGDFAAAIWDNDERALIMARSPLSLKPLFYFSDDSFLAFASMPAGLFALPHVPKRIDMAHAAFLAALHFDFGDSTIFDGVRTVRQGHIVRLAGTARDVRRFWGLERATTADAQPGDYAEQLRAEMDRAVRAQLRRHHGKVASQLSAGRDSSAVTSTAARILAQQDDHLIALTAAPPEHFRGPTVDDRLTDEAPIAARAAAAHANIRHLIVRPESPAVLDQMSEQHRLSSTPLLSASNLAWWEEMHRAATDEGATVLLFGSNGNFTISAGGVDQLRDMLIEDGPMRWIRTAFGVAGLSPGRWRRIANLSFGPSLPPALYRQLLKVTGRSAQLDLSVPFLRQPYRRTAEEALASACGDPRPPRSFADYRLGMMAEREQADLATLGLWGLEARDPTTDRRLVEFCLSLPSDQLVSPTSARPVYEAAFGDRLPVEVLTNVRRGYQTPEWYEHFRKDEVRGAFHAYGANPIVRELLDLDYIDHLIDDWPTEGWGRRPIIYTYRNSLIGILALANFISVQFAD